MDKVLNGYKIERFISIDDAPPIPFDSMTKEQHTYVMRCWRDKLLQLQGYKRADDKPIGSPP